MRKRALIVILAMCIALFSGCARPAATPSGANEAHRAEPDHGSCLTLTCDDPDNIDPQCTTEHYMVALNAFDRLVEVHGTQGDGPFVFNTSSNTKGPSPCVWHNHLHV